MSDTFILVPGRTSKQGTGINEGKFKENYQEQIHTLQMCPEDMQRLGLETPARVRVTVSGGKLRSTQWRQAPMSFLGLLFMAYGDPSSRLMGGDTHGSGMPTNKGLDVTVEPIEEP